MLHPAGQALAYPLEVHHRIRKDERADYLNVAQALNRCVDVVSIQHEYGIWGGEDGEHVLDFVRALRVPVAVTLHTVLRTPTPHQQAVLTELVDLAETSVVMSRSAANLLMERYDVDRRRLAVIPHGVPNVPRLDADTVKPLLGVDGREVLLSFGLLGPGKGYELAIEALSTVAATHRDVLYVIVGATHPDLLRTEGEAYRQSLVDKIGRLGLERHVRFVDRFVGRVELTQWLQAADAFVTPYPNMDQIVSGTLSYAMGAGCAVVSTPYTYARELLADGRGVLVPPGSAAALADGLNSVLDDPELRAAIGRRAHAYTRRMVWSAVGAEYAAMFAGLAHGSSGRRRCPRGWPSMRDPAERRAALEIPAPLHPVSRRHLAVLTGELGIFQHAIRSVPDPDHGHCVDDVARALEVDLLHARTLGWSAVADSARRNLQFLEDAFDETSGRFLNFRSVDGEWLGGPGSNDSLGRAILALGETIAGSPDARVVERAITLFERALPSTARVVSPRARASIVLGCAAVARCVAVAGSEDERDAAIGLARPGQRQPALETLAARFSPRLARQGDQAGPVCLSQGPRRNRSWCRSRSAVPSSPCRPGPSGPSTRLACRCMRTRMAICCSAWSSRATCPGLGCSSLPIRWSSRPARKPGASAARPERHLRTSRRCEKRAARREPAGVWANAGGLTLHRFSKHVDMVVCSYSPLPF